MNITMARLIESVPTWSEATPILFKLYLTEGDKEATGYYRKEDAKAVHGYLKQVPDVLDVNCLIQDAEGILTEYKI